MKPVRILSSIPFHPSVLMILVFMFVHMSVQCLAEVADLTQYQLVVCLLFVMQHWCHLSNFFFCPGPTTPPQNFAASAITSESFTLSWTLIPGFQPGGLQIGYDIMCSPGNHLVRVNLNNSACIFIHTNIEGSINYKIIKLCFYVMTP